MTGRLDLGRFKRRTADPDAIARIKGWAIDMLGLRPEDTVSVNEIDCADPACPGRETVILILRRGEAARSCRSPGAAVVQTRPMIVKALSGTPFSEPERS